MRYLGDYPASATLVEFYFNTKNATTAAPITLAGSPTLAIYRNGGTTQFTSGSALTVDFDGVTGLHRVVIDLTSSATNYAPGGEIVVTLATGTVDGVSVVGQVLASFSIQRLQPSILGQGVLVAGTTSSLTLAGSTAVGIVPNQAGILITSGAGRGQFKALATVNTGTGVCTPATNFTTAPGTASYIIVPLAEASTDISTITTQLNAIQADTDDIQTRLPTALVGGAINANISGLQANVITSAAFSNGAINNNTFAAGAINATTVADGTIDAATFAANAITASALAADAGSEIGAAVIAAASATPIRADLRQVQGNALTGSKPYDTV